ncbi:hypothetical protein BC941DRAFT_509604 [Chlamydoabsidia padenii]|nr:hypothetical protein BC941DRAFT_509604 [Chlamydoabsidia padenii]
MRSTLFVAGFGIGTRAAELAYEFERYGRLVRCDIPAPKSYSSKPYAFVEYEDPRDAEDAFNEMHGRRIDTYTISVQWARNAPSASWRYNGQRRRRRRSISPYPLTSPRDDDKNSDNYRYYSHHHLPRFSPYGQYPPMHYRYHRREVSPRQRYYSRSPVRPRSSLSPPSVTSSPHYDRYPVGSPVYRRPYSPRPLSPPQQQRSISPPTLGY